MKIYVSNLDFSVDNAGLKSLFEEFGEVNSANVITDQNSGRSRGFGFVEISDKEAADTAVKGINGRVLNGRALSATEAHERARKRSFE
jgi:RNA recognition motif-containing protein